MLFCSLRSTFKGFSSKKYDNPTDGLPHFYKFYYATCRMKNATRNSQLSLEIVFWGCWLLPMQIITFRCKSWKILSINWLNIARMNIEPKNTVQLIENGITHYYIAYCIFLSTYFTKAHFFLFSFIFFCVLCFFNTNTLQIYRFLIEISSPAKEKRTCS